MMLDAMMAAEQSLLLQSFQKCLELRDKYMLKSCQRLGDDPRDYDGVFKGVEDEHKDVSGVRPDSHIWDKEFKVEGEKKDAGEPGKWKIYPKPPPPHWHWKDKNQVVRGTEETDEARTPQGDEEFVLKECEIPGVMDGWSFKIDVKGVYQVYEDAKSAWCTFNETDG